MKRKLIILIVLAAVGGGGYLYLTHARNGRDDESATPHEMAAVTVGSIKQTVTTDGMVMALLVVDVKSKASGTVVSVNVNESDHVYGARLLAEPLSDILNIPVYTAQDGQILVVLDPVDEQPNVNRQRALVAAETAKLHQAEADLIKIDETTKAEVEVAEAELKSTASDAQAAKAQKESAQEELSGVQISLADAKDKAERRRRLLTDIKDRPLIDREDYETALTAVRKFTADGKQKEAAIRSAEAQIAQAEAKEVQAAAKLRSAQAGRRQVDVQRQLVALARANVAKQGIDLSDAERRLRETKIVAPIDGLVLKRSVDTGQVIASGTQNVGGGTSLLTIADVSQMFVIASVPEADIALVRDPENGVRQKVFITADAYPGQVFDGEVVFRVPQATTENNVTTVKVRIEVTDPQKYKLFHGMTTNVEILAQQKKKTLVVQAAAVGRGDKGDRFVYVMAEGKPRKVPVEVGIVTATQIEITKGLTEGQQVVASAAAVDQPAVVKKGGGGGRGGAGGGLGGSPRIR